jgi:hypothetical protein
MWPFKSEEEKRIDDAINKISKFIIDTLKDKGLITLYLAGTILDKEERVATSDIDFFAIVESEFDLDQEKEINNLLISKKHDICNDFECRLRVFPLCSLQGGEIKGILRILRPERLVQRLPFFKIIWGKKWDYEKDFIKPMTLQDEAQFLIQQIEKIIVDVKAGKEGFPIKDFPKFLIELVRVEAQMFHNYTYNPSRSRLAKHLSKDKEHIIHKAMILREKDASREELLSFIKDIEGYIKFFKEKV